MSGDFLAPIWLRIASEIGELALNHTLKGMERIYDARDEIPQRREAVEIWARFIVNCCDRRDRQTERPPNVGPMLHQVS